MVVENVRGAQPWVGRARWNYGSYYLWGDVPALMPQTVARAKRPGHDWNRYNETGEVSPHWRIDGQSGIKTPGPPHLRDGEAHTKHLTNPGEHGQKVPGFRFDEARAAAASRTARSSTLRTLAAPGSISRTTPPAATGGTRTVGVRAHRGMMSPKLARARARVRNGLTRTCVSTLPSASPRRKAASAQIREDPADAQHLHSQDVQASPPKSDITFSLASPRKAWLYGREQEGSHVLRLRSRLRRARWPQRAPCRAPGQSPQPAVPDVRRQESADAGGSRGWISVRFLCRSGRGRLCRGRLLVPRATNPTARSPPAPGPRWARRTAVRQAREADYDDSYPRRACSDPGGHSWVVQEVESGEGRSYCEWCGADGDA